jgi:TM2 domain.
MSRKLLFFLCLIEALALRAQTVEESLIFAREQLAIGNETLARKTYQRALFFSPAKHRDECQRQLSLLYESAGELDKAVYYCDLLYQGTRSDSLRYEALFSKTGILMLQHQYPKALLELFSLPQNLQEPWASRKQLYLGAAHFGMREFGLARKDLLVLFAENDFEGREKFESLMKKAERAARKNPKTARLLSLFLPGAGQFYAGDVKNGLNSMLLNLLLGYWFVATGVNYSFVDAGASIAPWLFRYYAGGIRRAGDLVEKNKEERLRKYFRQTLELVKNE